MTKPTTLNPSSDSLCEINLQHRLKELRERIEQLEDYSAQLLAWGHRMDTIRKQLMIGLFDEQDAREKDQAQDSARARSPTKGRTRPRRAHGSSPRD